ncbi:MAG: GNAT family protein [Anaerolineae bacterium]|nr:GNAT family protein [Anaerolineae bacterium]
MYYDGELVRLRPPERTDLTTFVSWLKNPALRQYITIRYISDALEERWFESYLEDMRDQSPGRLHFVIELKASGQPIGVISLEGINWRDRVAEVGIIIGDPDYWEQGYGTDAMRTILSIGFDWYNLYRISLNVVHDNTRAISVYEKCGFQVEGRMRDAIFIDGEYRDLLLMSILKDEMPGGDD